MESSALHEGVEIVIVKAEPCEDVCIKEESPCEEVSIKAEPLLDVCVKVEPWCEDVSLEPEPSCSEVKEELVGVSAAVGLYAGHAVKDELVLGPELVEQRQAPTGQTEQWKSAGRLNIFKCAHCRYVTARKLCFMRHLRNHFLSKHYKCEQYSYATVHNGDLLKHKMNHTGEKPYQCKYHVRVHEKRHTSEKPYKCDQCSYACAHKHALLKHKMIHTGEKPYRCSQCNYAGARKYCVQVHEMHHTGEKPYQCGQCGYASVRKGNLRVHQRKHHATGTRGDARDAEHDHTYAALESSSGPSGVPPDHDSASDSAVSSMGSERVPSLSDESDSAQEFHSSKCRPCNGSYGRVRLQQLRKKLRMYSNLCFQNGVAMPERVPHNERPATRDKRVPRLDRDEKRANALGIPMAVHDIINLPMNEFNETLSKHDLSEAQLSLIRDIRRRGKNKVAAQNCRKRKLDQITCLADEVRTVRDRKVRTQRDHHTLTAERQRVKERFAALYRHVFQNLLDVEGRPLSSAQYSLQQAADGNVVLVPKMQHDHPMNRPSDDDMERKAKHYE